MLAIKCVGARLRFLLGDRGGVNDEDAADNWNDEEDAASLSMGACYGKRASMDRWGWNNRDEWMHQLAL